MRRLETLAAASTTLQAYLQEIAKFRRLALDEERELGRRIQQRDDDAIALLVEGHLRFVVAYARRYRRLGVPVLDLIHEGNLGLLFAARQFDPDRDGRFAVHALWWVRQNILRRLAEAQELPAFAPTLDNLPRERPASAALDTPGDTVHPALALERPQPRRRTLRRMDPGAPSSGRFESERIEDLRRRQHLHGCLN